MTTTELAPVVLTPAARARMKAALWPQENLLAPDTLTPQRAEIARLTAELDSLKHLLAEWARTFPDLGDEHDSHSRGHYYTSTCPGCHAEWELLKVADAIAPDCIKAQVLA